MSMNKKDFLMTISGHLRRRSSDLPEDDNDDYEDVLQKAAIWTKNRNLLS